MLDEDIAMTDSLYSTMALAQRQSFVAMLPVKMLEEKYVQLMQSKTPCKTKMQ